MKRKITAIVLVLMVAMMPVTSFGLDTIAKGEAPEFKCFESGGVTYYDIYGGQTKDRPDITDMDSMIDKTLGGNIIIDEKGNTLMCLPLTYWAVLADSIFAANPSSWRENGESNGYGSNKTINDYMDRFVHNPDKSKSYYGNVYDALRSEGGYEASTNNKSKYRKCDINMKASGRMTAKNLSEVQDKAFQYLVDINPGNIKKSDFAKYNAIPTMTEDTGNNGPVIYYLMASRDREGGTFFYEYNCFGIAYSDFEVVPVTGEEGEGLTTALKEYDTYDEAVEALESGVSVDGFTYENDSKSVIDESRNSKSTVVRKTLSSEWSKDESLTSEISSLKGKTFTAGQAANFSFGKDDAIFKAEVGVDFSEEEMFEEGISESNTVSAHDGGSSGQEVDIPAHTVLQQVITTNSYDAAAAFDCPVQINYKVTIFSYNGCYYDDNAATTYFNTAGYEQRSFIAQFGNNDDGTGAIENFRERYARDEGYDTSHGVTRGTCIRHGNDDDATWEDPWIDHLNYSKIQECEKALRAYHSATNWNDIITALTKCQPISITGGVMNRAGTSVSSVINEAIPIYPLESVSLAKAQRDIVTLQQNEDLHLRNINLEAWDTEGIEFYNFKPLEGYWSIINKSGEKTDKSDVISLYQNSNGDYVVRAKETGKVKIQYFIEDDTYQYMDKNGELIKIKAEDVETPTITITVREDKSTPAEIDVQDAVTVEYKDSGNELKAEIDMDMIEGLDAVVYDSKGKVMEVAADWSVADKTNGIIIEDNILYVYRDGTYGIKAVYQDVESDIVELTVTASGTSVASSGSDSSGSSEVQVSDEAVKATEHFLSCDSDNASLAEACFFVKNKLGQDSTLNEIIYAETLFELAGAQSSTDEQKEYELQAVLWAIDNDLVDRELYNVISVNGGINKTQMVTLAYNAAVKFGRDVSCEDLISSYTGWESLTEQQKTAMNWAISKGCVTDSEKASMVLDMSRIITDYDLARLNNM